MGAVCSTHHPLSTAVLCQTEMRVHAAPGFGATASDCQGRAGEARSRRLVRPHRPPPRRAPGQWQPTQCGARESLLSAELTGPRPVGLCGQFFMELSGVHASSSRRSGYGQRGSVPRQIRISAESTARLKLGSFRRPVQRIALEPSRCLRCASAAALHGGPNDFTCPSCPLLRAPSQSARVARFRPPLRFVRRTPGGARAAGEGAGPPAALLHPQLGQGRLGGVCLTASGLPHKAAKAKLPTRPAQQAKQPTRPASRQSSPQGKTAHPARRRSPSRPFADLVVLARRYPTHPGRGVRLTPQSLPVSRQARQTAAGGSSCAPAGKAALLAAGPADTPEPARLTRASLRKEQVPVLAAPLYATYTLYATPIELASQWRP